MSMILLCALASIAWVDSQEFQVVIDSVIELPCSDCDGVALGDINDNGKMDVLASSGKHAETFWFEQGTDYRNWTKRPIYQISLERGEIEGNDLADFDGDGHLEAISLDQKNGRVLLHKIVSLDADHWETAVIQDNRPFIQASLVADITADGSLELVYTWEGDQPGTGGVHVLQFIGEDVLNPEHWRDHPLIQHESAWWLLPRRLDMSGNGAATDIVYTARRMPRRNPGTTPGLYWLEIKDGLAAPVVRHVLDDTLPHPLQVDLGNFSGAGHGEDLVIGGFNTNIIYWYERDTNWTRHEIALPSEVNGISPNLVWNVKSIPVSGHRDALLAPVTGDRRGALLCFEYIENGYRPNILRLLDYDHPMDDRIVLHDLSGDGLPEAVIPDSGPRADRLLIIFFVVIAP